MTLEQIVCLARLRIEVAPNSVIDPGDVDIRIANAVRAFLGSEEVLEAAASAIAKQNDGCEWSQMSERAKQWEIGVARAALSSIGGE